MPDWRRHPLTDRTVRIAPARATRPNDFQEGRAARRCPFCGGAEADTPEESDRVADDTGNWLTRVVPNRFPAVEGDAGLQEVIVESPRHVRRFADLTPPEATAAVTAWARRITHWRADGRFDHTLVFKNEGPTAGASLQHIHSQVMVLPEPPERVAAMWRAYAAGKRPIDHAIEADDLWQTAAPDAFRFAYETVLRPTDNGPSLAQIAEGIGADRLAATLTRLVTAVTRAAKQDDYNLIVQAAPASLAAELGDPWWIEVVPRSSVIAGLELATDLWVSAVPPEEAARQLADELALLT